MSLGIAFFRIGLSILFGGMVGFERQRKHHPAGLRTNILVCLGSTLVMLVSELLFNKYYILYGTVIDPSRLGAQVISGIGFLGAGTIIYSESKIRGLTTAASLWAVACIGLAVGAGFYWIAGGTAVLVFIILFILNGLSHKLDGKQRSELLLIVKNDPGVLGKVIVMLNEIRVNIEKLHIEYEEEDQSTSAKLTLLIPGNVTVEAVMGVLNSVEGVLSVEKLS